MGDDDRNDSVSATDGLARRRPHRLFVLAGLLGIGLALLLGVLLRDVIPGPWRKDTARDNPFPPGALADYVPEDSEAVVAVDLRSLRESPVGHRLAPALKQLVGKGERRFRWIDLVGVKPFDDLDNLLISFSPGTGGQPLWLVRGRFDRSRFQVGPDRLEKKTVEHFRVWEYPDRQAKRSTLLAPVGDALVVSDTPARVLAALDQASHPRPLAVRDDALGELLTKVERGQTLWLIVSFKHLGHLAEFDSAWMKLVLTPLFKYAESVHGGVTCAEDVRAELHFRAATEENAEKLEADLKSIRDLAPGAALLLGRQRELLPLFRLIGSAQTSRDGKNVSLRCRLAGDQLDG
ncbi:MAG TPA: hypothetical protein VH643_34240 [Gemmataceae bacterium]|jgi:hypothetical protein